MKKLIVAGLSAVAFSCAAESPFGDAKWIGSNAALTPAIDCADAEWVRGDAAYLTFRAEEGKPYELAVASEKPFAVTVNGTQVYKWSGHVYGGRRFRFVNLTPYLERGENEISVSHGKRDANILAFVRTGATFVAALKPGNGGKAVGPLDATAFGRSLFRCEETASPAFARRFSVGKNAKSATLVVTGVGFYEAQVDGKKVGDLVLDPSPTDYVDRVLYSTYDLGRLEEGEHELRILLGHGWFDLRSLSTWDFYDAPWRDFPQTIARLEIAYGDGTKASVVTDGTWEHVENPVAYDCLREGEIVDARKTGRPCGFKAAVVAGPRGALEPRRHPGSRIVERFSPERVTDLGGGRWLVTFPKTVSGWVRATFRGLASGDIVTVRYDENLDDDGGAARGTRGNWAAARLSGRRAIDCFFHQPGSGRYVPDSSADTDHFISAGGAEETFEPRFVYHGFRHVLVEGLKRPLAAADVTACRVMTDFRQTGSFACSDAALTALVEMTGNSYRANFADGIPTDCPHREKLGWTGDGWIASEFGLLTFDTASSYRKWLRDIIDTQVASGEICCIAPTSGWGFSWGNGPVFDNALAMVPWNLWTFCGDRAALEEAYPALVRYLRHVKTRESAPDLVAWGLGDWNAAERSHMPATEYVVSCAYLQLRETAAKMADVLGRPQEASAYAAAAEQTRAAVRAKYARGNGVFDNGGQTAQALAVAFGLARNGEERRQVADRLADSVVKTDCHIDFGLMGAKFVYRALADVGRADLAYRMIVNPTEPTMTKWIGKNGTLWEDFTFGFSKCHIMLGDFAAWARQYVAGLRRPTKPGFAETVVEPTLLPGMTWAKGSVMTPRGELKSSWRLADGTFELTVTVPSCVRAEVVLPSGARHPVAAGEHVFKEKQEK